MTGKRKGSKSKQKENYKELKNATGSVIRKECEKAKTRSS
jgi:hypothetical protein